MTVKLVYDFNIALKAVTESVETMLLLKLGFIDLFIYLLNYCVKNCNFDGKYVFQPSLFH